MLYVGIRKSFEVRRGKILFLCRMSKKTLGKLACSWSAKKQSTNKLFAECFFLALGEQASLPSVFFLPSVCFLTLGKWLVCRVPDAMHSANL